MKLKVEESFKKFARSNEKGIRWKMHFFKEQRSQNYSFPFFEMLNSLMCSSNFSFRAEPGAIQKGTRELAGAVKYKFILNGKHLLAGYNMLGG